MSVSVWRHGAARSNTGQYAALFDVVSDLLVCGRFESFSERIAQLVEQQVMDCVSILTWKLITSKKMIAIPESSFGHVRSDINIMEDQLFENLKAKGYRRVSRFTFLQHVIVAEN